MYSICVNDLRPYSEKYDNYCGTTNDTIVKVIRKKYKEGVRNFRLDLNDDVEDTDKKADGKEFINVLKELEAYVHLGKMAGLKLDIIIHINSIKAQENIRDIIYNNSTWMKEV